MKGLVSVKSKSASRAVASDCAAETQSRDYVSRSRADLATLKAKIDDGKAMAAASRNDLANSRTVIADADKREKRTKMTDAERRAELDRVAREHGADLSEKGFNEALGKVARYKPPGQ